MRRHRPAGRGALAIALAAVLTGCAGAQPPRALPALVLGEPSFFPTLEAYAAAPIVGGNRVEVLLNGEQIFPAVLEAVAAARTTISYAQHVWEDGPVARDVAGALAERCRAGIRVNVLLDGVGTRTMPASQLELLRTSGCQVAHFRPADDGAGGRRNNRRIIVVDGLVGFTGASGVGRRWMGNGQVAGHWRDTDVRLEGPAVEHLQGAFAESWLEATGVVLGGPAYFPRPRQARGPVYAQVVRSSPAAGSRTIYTTLLLAIASARRSISITGPALFPDGPLTREIVAAARRGVRVVALVPPPEHGMGPLERARLRMLQAAGVQIHAYRPARLNARTIVIDDVWATVGSFTLDHRTFGRNDEVNLVVYNVAVAERLQHVFLGDLAHARPLDRRAADAPHPTGRPR